MQNRPIQVVGDGDIYDDEDENDAALPNIAMLGHDLEANIQNIP